jgi:c-di-GMP-binding flagellar brake protein YcgR
MDPTPDATRLPGEGSPFWIQSPLDIRQQFKLLGKRGERIRLWFGPDDSIVSLVLDVTQSGDMVLDVGPDARSNQRLLAAACVVMHGSLDGVDLKCSLGPMRETMHEGLPAFSCTLPQRLHRLQRREYHRVSIPVGLAVKCEIPPQLKPADAVHHSRRAVHLIDISLGGLALEEVPGSSLELSTGMILTNCRLQLDDMGVIQVDLEIRYLSEIQTRSGQVRRKMGGMFKRLSSGGENLIQRFINRLDLDKKTPGPGT